MPYRNYMSVNMITNKPTKERQDAARALRVVYKKQLKTNPELKQVIELYGQGAIKTATKTMEILQKHPTLGENPAKQGDYLAKALKKPQERSQQPARRAAATRIQWPVRNTVPPRLPTGVFRTLLSP